VLQRFVDIMSEVIDFLEGEKKLGDRSKLGIMTYFSWLCGITSYLSQLNKQLQGMSQLILDMLNAVKSFLMILNVFTN
jgi:hypothetical protein